MHAIDTPGSVAGHFSDGNPATGIAGTILGAAWLDDLQGNLLQVLAEGGIAPTKGRIEDLADAIVAIVAGAVGTGGASVPTDRQITGGGLVTGGGNLSANRELDVAKASAAEIGAGTEDGKAITPAGLFAALSGGLGGGSQFSFQFGPIVFKAGVGPGANESTVYTPFEVPFPNSCVAVVSNAINTAGSTTRDIWTQLQSWNANGFTTVLQLGGGGTTNIINGFIWMALGH